jgi:hypothetical protein
MSKHIENCEEDEIFADLEREGGLPLVQIVFPETRKYGNVIFDFTMEITSTEHSQDFIRKSTFNRKNTRFNKTCNDSLDYS